MRRMRVVQFSKHYVCVCVCVCGRKFMCNMKDACVQITTVIIVWALPYRIVLFLSNLNTCDDTNDIPLNIPALDWRDCS